ncbi:MAG: MtnX-like HAD-IB family phosphatase [Smithellaceae bacterium]|nr:MtnX-like HAD-IB family phosphatase [Smithellaceae bacterium]
MFFQQKKVLVLSDFDGTISRVDVGDGVLGRFAQKCRETIDREVVKGNMGSREAYEKIAPLVRVDAGRLRAYVLKCSAIDPFFVRFYRLAAKKGVDVKIVSDGLDFYIRAILDKHRLGEIEFYSNNVVFGEQDTLMFDFPRANVLCGRCGTCKSRILHEHRLMYEKIIYVGDGRSDICPSQYADLIFAKGELLKKCRQESAVPYRAFHDFREVSEYLKKNV